MRRSVLNRLLRVLPLVAGVVVLGAHAGTVCTNLTALQIPGVTISAATSVSAGAFTPPGSRSAMALPAFCRVEGVAKPTIDSEIRFEVWIPPADTWNNKFQGVGNGGYSGSINYGAMAPALRLGYAAASTDTGHAGDDLKFGEGHPEKVVDWAYRAIHVTAETSKLIVRSHTGQFPKYSYFTGCSTGGHQALSEAQRFPEDYDGIVAGDPAYDRINQTVAFLSLWAATHKDGVSLLSGPKLSLMTKAAVARCDSIDGIRDGVIDDPRRCDFDPASLVCRGAEADSCLTAEQVEAVNKVYAGVRNPRTNEEIFPGWSRGSEGFGETAGASWRGYLLDPPEPMRVGVLRSFLFNDPNWDWRTMDFDRDVAYAHAKLGFMSAVNRDLGPFKRRGGKLLMYTGWADPVAAPLDIVKYYEGVVSTMGGLEDTQQFFRFFMAPGMGHLQWWPRSEYLRFPWSARAVGRARCGTATDRRRPRHQRGHGSDAAALPVPASRQVEWHAQHR